MGDSPIMHFLRGLGLDPDNRRAAECLQFASAGSKETTAILGLDFGTSCTKAVIHLPFVPNSPAFAVPLSPGSANPFLRPTTDISISGALAGTATHSPRPNPKVDLLVNPDDPVARARVAVMLAGHMRSARAWFLKEQKTSYGAFKLKWQANVGVPSSGYTDDAIRSAIQRCAETAWQLSLDPKPPTVSVADAALQSLALSNAPIGAVPEIAAASEAYRRSLFAKGGLHVMLDVGASTLDICGFSLQPKSPDKPFILFAALVEHLGAAVLHDDRVRAVLKRDDKTGPAADIDPRDPATVVPNVPVGYVAGATDVPAYLSDLDELFGNQCGQALRTVLVGLYQMHPLAKWGGFDLPVFLTGGGGRMGLYREVVEDIPVAWPGYGWSKLVPTPLAQPTNLLPKGLSPEVCDRLLVAYGLSMPGVGDWDITNPAELPKVPPPPMKRLDDRYVGKELT